MSLLEKYKNVSPTPKPFTQMTIDQFEYYKKQINRQNRITRIKKIFYFIILFSSIFFTIYNYVQCCRSFDNCERLITQIKQLDLEYNEYMEY